MVRSETEDGYTRQRGARDLLGIIQQLTRPSFIHRPFDAAMTQHLERRFTRAIIDLETLGYEKGSDAIRLLEQSRQVVLKNSNSEFLPYPALAEIVKLVMDSVVSLSVSASPFPLDNLHLPREILMLILSAVLEDKDLATRQRTLFALSATARDWRQVVKTHRCVFLGSERALESWMQYRKIREVDENTAHLTGGDIAELAIDLSRARPKLAHIDLLRRAFKTTGEVPETSIRSVSVMLPTCQETQRPQKYPAVYHHLAECVVQRRPNHSIIAAVATPEEFVAASDLIAGGADWTARLELTIEAASTLPQLCPTRFIRSLLTRAYGGGADKPASPPLFTNYASLVLPWHVFTVDDFLLRSIPAAGWTVPLPPSRLERLELTLKVNQLELDKAARDVESFFSVLAPKLQHLALRVQVWGPFLAEGAEAELTSYFVRGLESCKELRHLEIGGNCLARDLAHRLANVPLKCLVLLPTQHGSYPRDLVSIFSRPTPLSASLKTFEYHLNSNWSEEDSFADAELAQIGLERDITIRVDDREGEATLLRCVSELAGIDLSW
ncbi:hypothetical protein JCM11491_004662 [Sporobolomyces phaffii]